jgi:hypothetical protein
MSYTPNTDAAARARALPKAAVPQAARGPEIRESGYLVEEIGDGLFWLADGVFQMMFAVTDEGVIAVDAPRLGSVRKFLSGCLPARIL